MPVDLTKYPDLHVKNFITAAKIIAGDGTGWPQRFVQLIENTNDKKIGNDKLPTISTSHLHNITDGNRPLNNELLQLILVLGPKKLEDMKDEAGKLESLIVSIQEFAAL